jgi:signal transduction histidine kinase
MYSTQISWAHWLLGIYVIHGTVVMLLLKVCKQSTPAFRALVHAADLMWPALIYVFATGRNLFFLFFVFVLAAAAYRWGLWETLGTAAGSLTLLWSESVALRHGLLAPLDGFLVRYHWPELGIDVGELEPKHLFILSVCLLVMGWLLGYLAEQHKLLRAELGRASVARELHDGVLQSLLGVEMRLHVLSDSQEGSTARELRQIQDILLEEARKLARVDAASETPGCRHQESAPSPHGDRWKVRTRNRDSDTISLRLQRCRYSARTLWRCGPHCSGSARECEEAQLRHPCSDPSRSQG